MMSLSKLFTRSNPSIPKSSSLKISLLKCSHLKMSYVILGLLNMSSLKAEESDFSKRVQKLNERQMALDEIVSQYQTQSTEPGKSSASPSGVSAGPLFQIHQALSSRVATVGERLRGSVLNRLVVGGEGSPVIVSIDDDEGRFGGLEVLGNARPGSTPDRIVIEFQKIRLSNGSVKTVQAIGLDRSGSLGIRAEVVSQKALRVAGALGASFVSGLAAAQQTVQPNAFGFEQTSRTGRNALLQGLAQTAADQSKRLIEEATEEKPIYIVEPGATVYVFFQEEVRL